MAKEKSLTKSDLRVLDFMQSKGSITTKQAIDFLGETRLSARIYNIRKYGYLVDGKFIEVLNRHGEKTHVKKYFIVKVSEISNEFEKAV